MARDITVTFDDGSSHVYANAPDSITFDQALARAQKDFAGRNIANIDGGRRAARPAEGGPAPSIGDELVQAVTVSEPSSTKRTSVLEGARAPAPLPTEDPMLRPEFVRAVETQLGALPAEQRAEALDKLVKRRDVYGRAARVVKGRFDAMDKAGEALPTISGAFDPRLEAQTKKLITEGGMEAESARAYAQQELARGVIPRVLPKFERDIAGEQAAAAAAMTAEEMQDAGFMSRVGAEVRSGLRRTALGSAQIYADITGDTDLQKDLTRYRQIESARGAAIPKGESIAERSAQQALATLTTQAPMIVLSAMTGTALPVLGQVAFDAFSQSYGEARGAGKTPAEAATRAGLMATAEVVFERFGLAEQLKAIRGVVDRVPTNQLSGYLTKALIKDLPAEQATTLSQFLVDKLPQIGLAPDAGFKDYLEQAGETLRQTVIQSGASSAAIYGAGAGARALEERALTRELGARDFEQAAVDEYARRALSPEFYRPETVIPGVRSDVGAPETRAPMPERPEEIAPAPRKRAPRAAAPAEEAPTPAEEAPAPAPAAPVTDEEKQAEVNRLVSIGVDVEDAAALVEKTAAKAAPAPAPEAKVELTPEVRARIDELTDEYVGSGLPPKEARALAIKNAQREAEADAEAAAAEGEKRAPEIVTPPSGEGVSVAGEPAAGAAPGRPARAKRARVVPPAPDVGQPPAREGKQPGAVTEEAAPAPAPAPVAKVEPTDNTANLRELGKVLPKLYEDGEPMSDDDLRLTRRNVLAAINTGLMNGTPTDDIIEKAQIAAREGMDEAGIAAVRKLIEDKRGVSEPAPTTVPKQPELPSEATQELKDVAKGRKRVPTAKVVKAKPGEIPPPGELGKPRGRPKTERTQEEADKAAQARRGQTLQANKDARAVATAEKQLAGALAPIPKGAPQMARQDAAAARKEAINTLYALSRRNKNKPGQRAAEALKNPKIKPEEIEQAKADYEKSKGLEALRPAKEEIRVRPSANVERLTKMLGSKLYGTPQDIAKVTIKELFQNSFDALKELIEKSGFKGGKIQVKVNEQDRTITVIDNGPGMPTSVMGNQFLQIAGTVKGTSRASGGLGVAKMLFLFENKNLEVVSLRDGVVSRMITTGDDLKESMSDPSRGPTIVTSTDPKVVEQYKAMFPEGHGTAITVQVPETYVDPSTGETKDIGFDSWRLERSPVLRYSPLLEPVEVTFQSSRYPVELPIGVNFPVQDFTPFANVNFDWGTARVYISKGTVQYQDKNAHILSNGLWQFSEELQDKPGYDGKQIPRTFYFDMAPKPGVKPEDPGYPFDLNRQRFSTSASNDINKIFAYISAIFGQAQFAEEVKNFGTVQYFEADGGLTTPELLEPKAPATPTALTIIRPDDDVEVRDGVLYVNNRALPDITPDDLKNTAVRIDELTIPQSDIRSDLVMVHDNTVLTSDPTQSLSDAARAKFGDRYDDYLQGVGSVFMALRNALVRTDPNKYGDLKDEAVGISIDPQYYGVSIKVPFAGMFINPAATALSNTPAEVATALLLTMQHELAHFKERNHGAGFVSELQQIINVLDNRSSLNMANIKGRLTDFVAEHKDVFDFLNKEFKDGNIEARGNRFQDASYEQIGDEGGAGAGAGAVGAGKGRPGVPAGAQASTTGAGQVSVGAGVPAQTTSLGPIDKRTAAQIEKETNKAYDTFEKSATATDIAEGVSLLQALRNIDKFKPYFGALYDKLDGARLSVIMQFMTNDSLVEWGSSYVPELNNTNTLLRKMRTLSRNLLEGAQRVSEEMQRAFKDDPDLKRKLERVTSVATDIRVDPSKGPRKGAEKLIDDYNNLGVKGQALFRKLRDYYASLLDYYEKVLDDQIAESNLPPNARQVLMAEIKKMYETDKKIVPFFPFVRNRGNFWLQVGKGAGRQFYTFANEAERQTVMEHIAKTSYGGQSVRELLSGPKPEFDKGDTLEGFRRATSDMTKSLKKIFELIDDSINPEELVGRVAELRNVIRKGDPNLSDKEVREKAYEQAREELTRNVKDSIYELYLMTLPDQSFRNSFIARKDIAGYNVDITRNFASYAVKTSSQLPRIKYGPKLRMSLLAAEKSLEGDPDKSKRVRFVDEMTRRVDLELNPYPTPPAGMPPAVYAGINRFVDFATRWAFVHYLSAGASAIVQSTAFLYGLSGLGARHGYGRTLVEVGKMARLWNEYGVSRKNDDGSVSFAVPSVINSKAVQINPLEQRFVRDMMGAGIGEYTLTSEMLNRGRVSTAAFEGRGSKLGRGAMMVLGGPFTTIERLVQETLAVPAFRMNLLEGERKKLKGEELYEYAAARAIRDVHDSVGNMAESNRPPLFRNAAGRFLLQFMVYPLFITGRWMKEAYRTVTASTGAAKYQAFKELSGIMGVTFMLAGVTGLPFFSTVLGYIGAWLEDEDEKMGRKTFKDLDYWTWWRTVWLPEYMGNIGIFGRPLTEVVGLSEQQLADLIDRGPTNMLTGVDIASRTSINPTDMFAGQNKEVRTTKEGALQFAEDRAGPFVGMILSYMDAYDAFADGDMQRGMEKMLPAIARNPAVAFKYYNEGIKDYKGATILKKDSMTTGRLIYQAIGFRLDEVANQQKFLFQLSKIENKVRFEREDILKNLRNSYQKKDFGRYRDWMKEREEFNRKYPSYAIDDDAVVRSVTSGAERAATAIRGFAPTEQNIPIFKEAVIKRSKSMREFEERTKE